MGLSPSETQISCHNISMARQPRIDLGNYVYHVINRANDRQQIFDSPMDYKDFEYLLNEFRETYDIRILAYIVMPNHWHLVLYPKNDGDLGRAMHWLTTSHVRRHHAKNNTVGNGHLYQGTYKSFMVETDEHYLTVLKYVERNAVRAKLSRTAESWRWGSAYRRLHGTAAEKKLIAESAVPLPRNYREWINDPEPSELLKDVRRSVEKTIPYGEVLIPNNITQ
jgi:putative transposase